MGSVLCFVWLWRTYQWPPDYRWGVGTFGALALFGLLVAVFSIKRICLGPDRFGAWAGFLLGMLPLIFWPWWVSDLYWKATTRQSLPRGWTVDPVAAVGATLADAEAHYRYPRRIAGRKVTMIDGGQPSNPNPLVDAMDSHIESMCDLLKTKLDRAVYWVRGPLLGSTGQSLAGWAICDDPGEPYLPLRPIDLHEVAHATLSLLCEPDSDPPTILTEGWAEFQSQDRVEMRRKLLRTWDSPGEMPAWNRWIKPEWYGKSDGLVYVVGGPLVEFLLEAHGPKKFLQLYIQSRRAHFETTFEQIYGFPWGDLESTFHQWLVAREPNWKSHVPNANPKRASPFEQVRAGPGIDPDRWSEIRDTLGSAVGAPGEATPEGAWMIQTVPGAGNDGESKSSRKMVRSSITKAIVQEKELWFSENEGDHANRVVVVVPEFAFEASRVDPLTPRRGCLVESPRKRRELRDRVLESLLHSLYLSNPSNVLRVSTSGPIDVVQMHEDSEGFDLVFQTQSQHGDPLRIRMKLSRDKGWNLEELEFFRRSVSDGLARSTEDSATSPSEPMSGWKAYRIERFRYEATDGGWKLVERVGSSPTGTTVETRSIASMDESQQRSFKDELRSIERAPCKDVPSMPNWLIAFRWGSLAWSLAAGTMGILFALFRF